jgi:hypothetical protein
MALLIASNSGCIAAATFFGLGSRSMRFTILGLSDVMRGLSGAKEIYAA